MLLTATVELEVEWLHPGINPAVGDVKVTATSDAPFPYVFCAVFHGPSRSAGPQPASTSGTNDVPRRPSPLCCAGQLTVDAQERRQGDTGNLFHHPHRVCSPDAGSTSRTSVSASR